MRTNDRCWHRPGLKPLRWVLSACCLTLLVYASRRVDWSVTIATARRATLAPLVAAAIVNFSTVLLRGVRWWIFLREVGACSLTLAMRGWVVGAGLNNVLVANGGDAARALLVARASGTSRSAILATLALERVFDPICFGLLLFAGTFLIPLPAGLTATRGVVGAGLLGVFALLLMLTRAPRRPYASVAAQGRRGYVQEFRARVQSLSSVRRFAAALATSIGVWALQIVKLDLVAAALHLELPLAGSIAAMLLINTGLLVRATPGNVGYFQVAYALATSRFGVPTDAAVAAALLIQAIEMVPVTLAALALAPNFPRADRDVDSHCGRRSKAGQLTALS